MQKGSVRQQTDSPVKRALRAIDDLQAKLAALERRKTEPIAVIGMGCRFPGGADSPDAFWDLLQNGRDAVIDLPAERWNIDDYYDADPDAPGRMYIRHGGFLHGIDRFDAPFFGISPREAMRMDPQHRLVLEVGWEALEHAGIAPADLNGSRTGVFVGIGQNDYARRTLGGADVTRIDTYDGTGNLLCFAAGRLAYILGLRGPNMAIDTACSSSLVTIHQACQSLRAGECDLALAGGVHLVISPEVTIFLSRAHVLSPNRHCRTFDAAADGFVRGEGCGMIVLKRLSDALQDGDAILALIRGSAVNHDGASSGLTVPSEPAQEALIRQAVRQAGVEPARVAYVEAHGTGTALGDPIEVNALAAALCEGRSADDPLLIGSVKTNLGHLEAAAGIAGVIKVVLALQHKAIPPHLHFTNPNPHIDWQALPVEVTARGRDWHPVRGPRIAGVSSFGFSGTNAHIVLEETPAQAAGAPLAADQGPHVLALSAKSDAALRALAERYADHLAAHPEQGLGDICFTANTGRSPFDKRVAVVAATRDEMCARLTAYARGRASAGLYTPEGAGEDGGNALSGLARQFVAGADIAWRDHYRGRGGRKVALPTYPFQRQRHWAETIKIVIPPGRAETLPPWGGRLQLPFSREVRFARRLTEASPAHLTDHRLLGTVVVSAASQVAMVLGAAAEAFGAAATAIEDMAFVQPLMIPAGEEKKVQLIYLPAAQEGAFDFRLVSAGGSQEKVDAAWTTHASGTVFATPQDRSGAAWPDFDPDRHPSRAGSPLAGDAFYTARRQAGYEFGPSFRRAQRIWRTGNELLCEMAPPRPDADGGGHPIHPGLLDACFQMIDAFQTAEPDARHLHVPVRIGRLTVFRPPPAAVLWCLAHRNASDGDDGRSIAGRLRLVDETGASLVEVDGLELGRARRALFRPVQPREAAVYEIEWRPSPSEAPVADGPLQESSRGGWLLFADRCGVAADLATGLRARGEAVFAATREQPSTAQADGRYRLDPAAPADFSRLLEDVGTPLKGIVYLWGLDIGANVDEAAIRQAESACAGLCAAVRACVERQNGDAPPALWWITRGAQPVGGRPVAPLQAMLWGLGAVLDLEHPEFGARGIDLWPSGTGTPMPLLLAELLHPDAERRIALYDGRRRVARLERRADAPSGGFHPHGAGSYLVTGGLGGLGLELAHFLVRSGARHIVLCGRKAPDGRAAQRIAQIEQAGGRILVCQADIADPAAVRDLMARIKAGMPPLRGIVHAAGVIDDAMLMRQDSGRFRKVMAPKVHGTRHLHDATQDLALDFFVCFSSAAAVVGAGGQANYAAANAFMDAFMHARRAQGLPGLSIAWGAWSEVGMAARMSADVRQRTAAQGMGAIRPTQGLDALAGLLRGDCVHACVMALDWQTHLRHHYPQGPPPFLAALAGGPATPGKPTEPAGAGWIGETPADERQARLFEYVRAQVAATLGMTSAEQIEPRQRLFDLGIDSLMAVELKNRLEAGLGVSLRTTLVFDYPTVEALVMHLSQDALSTFFAPLPAQAQAGSATPESNDDLAALLVQIEAMPEQALMARFTSEKTKQRGQTE